MIYHHHPLIFVGIPKNGSSSAHFALWDDEGCDPFYNSRKGHNEHNHNPLRDEMLFPYEKVCISRDPYTRTISGFMWWKYQIYPGHIGRFKSIFGEEPPTLSEYLKYLKIGYHELSNLNGRWEVHMKPQWWYVMVHGKLGVDRVLRLETIKDDWNKLRQDYPLVRDIPLENVTDPDFLVPELDGECIELINYLYRIDFEIFNYKMRQP